MAKVYLSLGTNLGNRLENINTAVSLIKERVGQIEQDSGAYCTAPWKMQTKNEFLNSVLQVETSLSPLQLLFTLQKIEQDMGRTQKTQRGMYEDRIIDIDILLYDRLHISTYELTIPHPHIWDRPFVMRGLAILDPAFIEQKIP